MTDINHMDRIKEVILLEKSVKERELKKMARDGASAILELKLTEIENSTSKKNKEIHKPAISYLNSFSELKPYLSKNKIENLNSKYEDLISNYWSVKNEK